MSAHMFIHDRGQGLGWLPEAAARPPPRYRRAYRRVHRHVYRRVYRPVHGHAHGYVCGHALGMCHRPWHSPHRRRFSRLSTDKPLRCLISANDGRHDGLFSTLPRTQACVGRVPHTAGRPWPSRFPTRCRRVCIKSVNGRHGIRIVIFGISSRLEVSQARAPDHIPIIGVFRHNKALWLAIATILQRTSRARSSCSAFFSLRRALTVPAPAATEIKRDPGTGARQSARNTHA